MAGKNAGKGGKGPRLPGFFSDYGGSGIKLDKPTRGGKSTGSKTDAKKSTGGKKK